MKHPEIEQDRKCMMRAVPLLLMFLAAAGCNIIPNRNPTGEPFPTVTARTLDGARVELPDSFAGQVVILVVLYDKSAQFDADRWMLGLLQVKVDAPIREVLTVPSTIGFLLSPLVTDEMKKSFPTSNWGTILTLYGNDADPVATMTGMVDSRFARVFLLSPDGRVAWFADAGYEGKLVLRLMEEINHVRRGYEGAAF